MTARKPETTFCSSVNKKLPVGLHYEKMNNPYRGGTADYWYSGNKNDLWIEYKWLAKPPTKPLSLVSGNNPMLSRLQQQWLHDRYQEGRNVAVIVGCQNGSVLLRHMAWIHLIIPSAFALTRGELATWIIEETTNDSTTLFSSSSKNDKPNISLANN